MTKRDINKIIRAAGLDNSSQLRNELEARYGDEAMKPDETLDSMIRKLTWSGCGASEMLLIETGAREMTKRASEIILGHMSRCNGHRGGICVTAIAREIRLFAGLDGGGE